MTETSSSAKIFEAYKRLETALNALDVALERSRKEDASLSSMEEELKVAEEDRSRLAQELDVSEAKVKNLTQVNEDVTGRVDQAMDQIRVILAKQ